MKTNYKQPELFITERPERKILKKSLENDENHTTATPLDENLKKLIKKYLTTQKDVSAKKSAGRNLINFILKSADL